MSVEFQFGQELNPESVALQSYKVKVNSEIGVDAYDNTQTYAVGDYCINANTIYKCTTAISTPEAWNASHWQSTSIMKEFSDVNASLVNLENNHIMTGRVSSNHSCTLKIPSTYSQSYWCGLVVGFIQLLGGTMLLIRCTNGSIEIKNLYTNQTFTDNIFTATFNSQTNEVTFTSSNAYDSIFTFFI